MTWEEHRAAPRRDLDTVHRGTGQKTGNAGNQLYRVSQTRGDRVTTGEQHSSSDQAVDTSLVRMWEMDWEVRVTGHHGYHCLQWLPTQSCKD